MARSILVLGTASEEHGPRAAEALRARGAGVLFLDTEMFPRDLGLAIDGEGAPRLTQPGTPLTPTLSRGERGPDVDLRRFGAAYVRQIYMALPFYDFEPDVDASLPGERLLERWRVLYAAERERQSFWSCVLAALERAGVRLVNPQRALNQHFMKLEQLAILRAAGLPVPRTLATNDPAALARFDAERRAEGGRTVYKPVAGGALCRRLEPEDLEPDRVATLAFAPVLFQEEVPGTNVRVYVTRDARGERIAAAVEIRSDALDYRGSEQAVLETPLPDDAAEQCLRAARACNMAFTGADLRRRPDGTHVFLELNPSPMYAGVERWIGRTPVTDALCDLLLSSPGA